MSIFSSNSQDVFRTQADNRFNSFSEPMNPVNMNPGNWGVNPNYLTPSYLSPFRPQYQGTSGESYSGYKPSWTTSVNQIFNPFAPGGENYGGNFMQQNNPYYDTLLQKPTDKAASVMQNLVVPGLASWAAYKYWGKGATGLGRAMGGGFAAGLTSRMAAGGIGGTLTAGGAWAGGLIGGIAFPAMAAQAAVSGVDSAVFDPYMAQRGMSTAMRDNFAGVSFGEGTGNKITGGGLSRSFAANIAKRTSMAGASDMTFSQEETSLLSDYASRSGLLDNTNSTQMASRFESILKQVKLVMSVANTSDFKETIEIMSKMQMAGASSSQLAGVMGSLGSSAAAGGQAMQKIFNTVGTQGQYMFGAAGLTPYMGQMAAAQASASMSTAYRTGLISPALLARMGGVEGATQSAVGGQIAMYKTPYANMMASNAYFGGGETGNVVTNMAQFGGRMSGNPLENIGKHLMAGDALTSRHLSDRGILGEQDQIYQLAKQLQGGGAINKDGKVGQGAAYMILTKQMGLTHEMAMAKLTQYAAYGDDKTVKQMLAGSERGSIDSMLKYQQQEGLNKGIFTTPYNVGKRGFMAVQRAGARVVGEVLEDVGAGADKVQNYMTSALFGIENESQREVQVGGVAQFDLKGKNAVKAQYDKNGRNYEGTRHVSQLSKINELAQQGDKNAITFLNSKGKGRADALDKLAGSGKLGGEYQQSKQAQALMVLADSLDIKVENNAGGKVRTLENTLGEGLNKVLPGNDVNNSIRYMTLMKEVGATLQTQDDVSPEKLAEIAKLKGVSVESLKRQDLREMSNEALKKSVEGRVYHLAGRSAGNLQELEAGLKKEGMPLLAPGMKASSDPLATSNQVDVQMAGLKDRSRIKQLVKEGKIDGNSGLNAINALDNKETVGKFSNAVDEFKKAVEGMPGTKNEGLAPEVAKLVQGGRAWWNR
jgi:hypothetical protein